MSVTLSVHQDFCRVRPGEAEPRVERYTSNREDTDGHVVARVLCTRCQECGKIEYDEV
jgi:hypothetical protein